MTFEERNKIVLETIAKVQTIHDKYTSSLKILSDQEWKQYIDSMSLIPNPYRDTNLEDLIGDLVMVFLNDTERMQKKLRNIKEVAQ